MHSMPAIVLRWSRSIRLFMHFDDRSVVSSQQTVSFHLARRAVGGRVAIERDGLRRSARALDRFLEEGLAALTSRRALSRKSTV